MLIYFDNFWYGLVNLPGVVVGVVVDTGEGVVVVAGGGVVVIVVTVEAIAVVVVAIVNYINSLPLYFIS